MRKIVLSAALICFTAACALFRSRPPEYPAGVVFPLKHARTIPIAGEIMEEVVREGDALYLAIRSGKVVGLDLIESKIRWTLEIGSELDGPITAGPNYLYATGGGRLHCLDRKGTAVWDKKLEETLTGGVCESGARVYVGTAGGLLALDASDGQRIWKFVTPEPVASNPVVTAGAVVFGCDDHHLYFVSASGKRVASSVVGGRIRGELLVDGGRVYFGAYDHFFYCADAQKRRIKWKVGSGGIVHPRPVSDGERIYFINQANVLYCLDKRNGTVRWWRSVPARSPFRPRVIDDKVVVTSYSTKVLCFHVETGDPCGEYIAPYEVGANPIWLAPHLGLTLFDEASGAGALVFLQKEIRVGLKFSQEPPTRTNEEIVVTAEAVGFFRPEYEFTLSKIRMVRLGTFGVAPMEMERTREVVREKSSEAAWSWFPEATGFYKVHLSVADEREQASAERLFRVMQPKKEKGEDQGPDAKAAETDEKAGAKKKPPTKKKKKKEARNAA